MIFFGSLFKKSGAGLVPSLEDTRLGFSSSYESGPNGTPDNLLASTGGGIGLTDFLRIVCWGLGLVPRGSGLVRGSGDMPRDLVAGGSGSLWYAIARRSYF